MGKVDDKPSALAHCMGNVMGGYCKVGQGRVPISYVFTIRNMILVNLR